MFSDAVRLEDLRQIGADQVAALVKLNGVPFWAIAAFCIPNAQLCEGPNGSTDAEARLLHPRVLITIIRNAKFRILPPQPASPVQSGLHRRTVRSL